MNLRPIITKPQAPSPAHPKHHHDLNCAPYTHRDINLAINPSPLSPPPPRQVPPPGHNTSTAMLRQSLLRSSQRASTSLRSAGGAAPAAVFQTQIRSAHAISNPTLANIEKRWEGMPPQEQADLWMALRDRMKVNWAELTLQEKKAAYYIAFGAHGPRAQEPPGEGWKVFAYTIAAVGVSLGVFSVIRMFGGQPPSTMNKEYQELTNEYLKAQNSEPISGISSEGYSGKGQVQSKPKGN